MLLAKVTCSSLLQTDVVVKKKEVLSFNTEKYEKQREKSTESASSLAIALLIFTIQLKLKFDCILDLSFAPTKRQHSKCQLYNF